MLGIRLDPDMDRDLEALAKHQGRTKSDLAREAIRRFLERYTLAAEARAQSLRASEDPSSEETDEFLAQIRDLGEWK